jgi:hypothetical protein
MAGHLEDAQPIFPPEMSEPSSPPAAYAGVMQKHWVHGEGVKATSQLTPAYASAEVADPRPIISQIVEHMRAAIRDGRQELRLVLNPESLGTIRVEVSTEAMEVRAQLLVDTPFVKEVLERDLHQLREALQARGLQVQDLAVSVGQHSLQQESAATHLPFAGRFWKPSPDQIADSLDTGQPGTLNGSRSGTSSLVVDLFV